MAMAHLQLLQEHPDIQNEMVEGEGFIEKVLKPHICYNNAIRSSLNNSHLKGIAHITGGGITENLNRILPCDCDANVDLSKFKIPAIFKFIKERGKIDDSEMLRTFNMGIGMALVVNPKVEDIIINQVCKTGVDCYHIGEIVEGTGNVKCFNKLKY